jgi:hypothetical protein
MMLLTYVYVTMLVVAYVRRVFCHEFEKKTKFMVWVAYMKGYTIAKSQHYTLIKKKLKFSSYIRKFQMEQLQSHI